MIKFHTGWLINSHFLPAVDCRSARLNGLQTFGMPAFFGRSNSAQPRDSKVQLRWP